MKDCHRERATSGRPPAAGGAWSASTSSPRSCSASAATTSAGSSGIGHRTRPASTTSPTSTRTTSRCCSAIFLGVVGFLIGLGFANYPFSRLLGRPPSLREKETEGIGRYFGLCTDHKVVGIQYLCGIGLFFFIGGLNAMLIRIELLQPERAGLPGAGQYLSLVGMHGTMMMGMMIERDPGPVRELLRAAHDRRPADGVPADRGAHLLAPDGGRGASSRRRSSSAASRPAGRAMSR